jgi:hypothetical protein
LSLQVQNASPKHKKRNKKKIVPPPSARGLLHMALGFRASDMLLLMVRWFLAPHLPVSIYFVWV